MTEKYKKSTNTIILYNIRVDIRLTSCTPHESHTHNDQFQQQAAIDKSNDGRDHGRENKRKHTVA